MEKASGEDSEMGKGRERGREWGKAMARERAEA